MKTKPSPLTRLQAQMNRVWERWQDAENEKSPLAEYWRKKFEDLEAFERKLLREKRKEKP